MAIGPTLTMGPWLSQTWCYFHCWLISCVSDSGNLPGDFSFGPALFLPLPLPVPLPSLRIPNVKLYPFFHLLGYLPLLTRSTWHFKLTAPHLPARPHFLNPWSHQPSYSPFIPSHLSTAPDPPSLACWLTFLPLPNPYQSISSPNSF